MPMLSKDKNYHFRNSGERKEFYFDDNKVNELPFGFQSAFTGKGEPGHWVVKKIEHAPSADNVVEQTKLDETDYRFPLLVLDGVSYKDFMAFVRFRTEGGKIDPGRRISLQIQGQQQLLCAPRQCLRK